MRRNHEEYIREQSERDTARSGSFDELVNQDGSLKGEGATAADAATSSGNDAQELRQRVRGRGSGMNGFQQGSAFANPFVDDDVLFDHGECETPTPPNLYQKSRESTAALRDVSPRPVNEEPDLDDTISYIKGAKARLTSRPERYSESLSILNGYQRASLSLSEATQRISTAFSDEPELVRGFGMFVPQSGAQARASLYQSARPLQPTQPRPKGERPFPNPETVGLFAPDPPVSIPDSTPLVDLNDPVTPPPLPPKPKEYMSSTSSSHETGQPTTSSRASSEPSSLDPSSSAYHSLISSIVSDSNVVADGDESYSIASDPTHTEGMQTPTEATMSTNASLAGDGIESLASQGEEEDGDSVMSEAEGISTPDSWSDIGSEGREDPQLQQV